MIRSNRIIETIFVWLTVLLLLSGLGGLFGLLMTNILHH